MEYIPIDNKSALNHLKSKMPYEWDLNIYRGCEHGCKYCYALYSHDYLNNGQFFDNIYYKKNILEKLDQELSKKSWKRETVNIGGVTDSYQPIEKKMKIMPEILKLFIKYKTPIIISTKSDLILRDLDLIDELSHITYVNVACTITAMNENMRKAIEPNAASSIRRFEILNLFRSTNVVRGVHIMPIIPYLTDYYENLERIYKLSSRIDIDYVLPGTLYLRGKTKPYFMDFIRKFNYPIYEKIDELFKDKSKKQSYRKELYSNIHSLQKKYDISSNYSKYIKNKLK